MKKFAGFLIIILLFAYIPIYSIWPIDYSSKTAHILILLGNLQITILETLSHIISILLPLLLNALDLTKVLILQLADFLLALPYENINPWYVLLGLFITSYFLEKFRTINNEISKLKKRILKNSSSVNNVVDLPTVDYSTDISKLNDKADSIMKLLEEISSAANAFKSKNLRSKKARRKSAKDAISISSNDTVRDQKRAKDEEQLMRLRKDADSLDAIAISSNNTVRDQKRAKDEEQLMRLRKDADSLVEQEKGADKVDAVAEIINDENISQIDLARALVASGENEDAKNLLKGIVENGSEDEKHEARLLFMQLK